MRMFLKKFSALILASFAISAGLSLPKNHTEPQPWDSRRASGEGGEGCCDHGEVCCGQCLTGGLFNSCIGNCSRTCQVDAAPVDAADTGYTCFRPVGATAPGGGPFVDARYAGQGISAISMAIQHSTYWGPAGAVTDLRITYGRNNTVQHGSNEGSHPVVCPLNRGEKITEVIVKWYNTKNPIMSFVFYLQFIIDGSSKCQVGDPNPDTPFLERRFRKPGCHLSYFQGRSGWILNMLGVCFECPK